MRPNHPGSTLEPPASMPGTSYAYVRVMTDCKHDWTGDEACDLCDLCGAFRHGVAAFDAYQAAEDAYEAAGLDEERAAAADYYPKMETNMAKRTAILETLPNGATLIARSASPRGDEGTSVVLAKWGNEYVTWCVYHGDDHNTEHGHYFNWPFGGSESDARDEAWADFSKRSRGLRGR